MGNAILEKKLKTIQNNYNIKHMKEKFDLVNGEFLSEMENMEMTKATIERFKQGTEIINCPSCNTPNMYNILSGKGVEYYKCDKCGKVDYKWKLSFIFY